MGVGRSGWLSLSFLSLIVCAPLCAQSDASPAKPYATLDRQSVTYRGPVSTQEKDQPGNDVVNGMILPMRGVQEPEGTELLTAAQIALEAEQARGALADGRKLSLAVRDESGPWGQASSEILKLVEQDHALVVLTSANGATAHQAEQIANKISFPILTLASDPTATQTNVPWLFRLGPSDADQARAFCQRISKEPGMQKILLIAEAGHDGRVGSAEFEKAAREMKLAVPERLELPPSAQQVESLGEAIRAKQPDAMVIWTDAGLAKRLLPIAHVAAPVAPVFMCSKAAQLSGVSGVGNNETREYFAVASATKMTETGKERFAKEYQTRAGSAPGIAAYEAYEAVHLVAAGIRAKGAGRVLLREYFANTEKTRGATAILSFDPAGNSMQELSIVKLNTAPEL